VAVTVVAFAGPAGAHTSFSPDTAAPGSVITLELNVANEESGASTTKVQLLFPDGQPIPVVELPPLPGWTATTDGGSLGAGSTATGVTWSRPTGPAGESPRLTVRLGPLPEVPGRLQFPVIQTYSNGEEVRWIEPTPEGGPEPEHPMPILTLVAGGPGDPAPATTAPTATAPPSTTTRPEATPLAGEDGGEDGGSNAGLIAALVAVVVVAGGAGAWWWRSRHRAAQR
jgi:hypothetical protein